MSSSLFAKAGHSIDRSFTIGRGFTIHRRYETPKQKEAPALPSVDTDARIVWHKDPAGRSNWLQGALLDVAKGALKNDVVWEIVQHDAFAKGMDNTVGSHVYETLLSNLHVFSKSQQKKLAASDFHLNIFKPAFKPTEERKDARGRRDNGRDGRDRRDGDRRRRRDDDSRDDSRERNRSSRCLPEDDEESGRRKRKRRRPREGDDDRKSRDDESEERPKKPEVVKDTYGPAAEAEAKRKEQLVKKFEEGGYVQVSEEAREQSSESQAGAKLLGQVMDQIRLVGLHEREKWSANDVAMCNDRHADLCKSLFTDAHYKAFKAQLRCFEKKEQGAGEFLQYLLQMLAEAQTDVDDDDAALFVSLVIIRLENKALRTALHERTRTLKKMLEEGRV